MKVATIKTRQLFLLSVTVGATGQKQRLQQMMNQAYGKAHVQDVLKRKLLKFPRVVITLFKLHTKLPHALIQVQWFTSVQTTQTAQLQ